MRATQRCTPHSTQVRHRLSKEHNRYPADAPCSGIRVAHPGAPRAMPLHYLQTRRVHIHSKLRSRKLAIDLLRRARSRTWTDVDDTAESAPEICESRSRYTCRQPTDPEHARWVVRTSKPGHHPCKFLKDVTRSRRIKSFPKLCGVLQRTSGRPVSSLCTFEVEDSPPDGNRNSSVNT
jgi:hypothetical protein